MIFFYFMDAKQKAQFLLQGFLFICMGIYMGCLTIQNDKYHRRYGDSVDIMDVLGKMPLAELGNIETSKPS
jgi:hypothetical protein